jgi:transcription elongation factor Elf1
MTPKQAEAGPVICGVCGAPFEVEKHQEDDDG